MVHATAWDKPRDSEFRCNDERLTFSHSHDPAVLEKQASYSSDTTETLTSAVLNNLGDAVIMVDRQGYIQCFNNCARQLTGYSADEVLGKKLSYLADEGSLLLCMLAETMLTKREYKNSEVLFADRQGHERVVLVTTSEVKSSEGRSLGAVGTYRDITAKKMSETRWVAADKLSAVSELAKGTAHEIRNSVTVTKGFLQLLQRRLDIDSHHRGLAEVALRELEQVDKVISQLLLITKPGAPVKESVNVQGILHAAIYELTGLMERSSVKAQYQLESELPALLGDYQQLKQVFVNVLTNACQAMLSGGDISIFLRYNRATGMVLVSVSDTGTGISAADLPHVTHPFFTTHHGALGMGLAICHNIVNSHGGTLDIVSTPGKGTIVTVALPAQTVRQQPC